MHECTERRKKEGRKEKGKESERGRGGKKEERTETDRDCFCPKL